MSLKSALDRFSARDSFHATAGAAAVRWYDRTYPFFGGVLGIYFAARIFSGVVLYLTGLHQVDVVWFENETGYPRMTVLWDAFWYRQIVEDGYPAVLPRDSGSQNAWQNSWAFYPMFPMLTRAIMAITGGGFALVGSTVALLFGALAAVLMAILLRDRLGPRVALAAVAVWATCVTSVILQVAYTESMALVLLCAVLLALTRERWWLAAGIALLTGLTRPIAVPLGLVALVAVFLRWRRRATEPVRTREWVAMFGALAACGLSGLIWPVIVGMVTGQPDGYTETMTAWRAYDEIQPFLPWWYSALRVFKTPAGAALALTVLAVAVIAMVAGPWARGLGPYLRSWCLAYPLYLFAVLDPTSSIYRYLILLFPWAVVMVGGGWGRTGRDPLAAGERPPRGSGGSYAASWRRPRPTVRSLWRWTAVWVVFGLVTQTWWIWEIWQFTPPADNPP